jgi:hypothetical protein
MSVAEEFRAKALACFQQAGRAHEDEYQRLFYDLGVQWLALAAEVDARAAGPVPPSPILKPRDQADIDGVASMYVRRR